MIKSGLKASQLIKDLKDLINQYGDREVFHGGGDYPSGVDGVYFSPECDGYVKSNSFKIY